MNKNYKIINNKFNNKNIFFKNQKPKMQKKKIFIYIFINVKENFMLIIF